MFLRMGVFCVYLCLGPQGPDVPFTLIQKSTTPPHPHFSPPPLHRCAFIASAGPAWASLGSFSLAFPFKIEGFEILRTPKGETLRKINAPCVFCMLSYVFLFFFPAGRRGGISVLTLTLHKNRLAGISVLMLTRGVY